MLKVSRGEYGVATIIVCVECPHMPPPEFSSYEFRDLAGNVHFDGNGFDNLTKFIEAHSRA